MIGPIRLLRVEDVPAWMRLKDAAGWNQTPQDLRMLLELEPEGCFGIDEGGVLVSTATAIRYQSELAWIGMVLTLPDSRGRGLATKLFEHSLRWLEQKGVSWIKLDATDMGTPLYRKFGFEVECAVERWVRPPSPWRGETTSGTAPDWSLDRKAFGEDRRLLLNALAGHEVLCLPGGSYAIGRPGSRASYFGPCIADAPETARLLLTWFLNAHPEETIFWDLFPDNANAARLAAEHGFSAARKLWRMIRRGSGDAPAMVEERKLVYGIAGFELG